MIRTLKGFIPVPLKDAIKRRLRRSVPVPDEGDLLAAWEDAYRAFNSNPFEVKAGRVTRETYLALAAEAAARPFPEFLEAVKSCFGFLPDKAFIDELALSTQVTVKSSRLLYVHGYLLYAALRRYLEDHPGEPSLTILETGTARGFSALCMAKALDDSGRAGHILTLDLLPPDRPIYWNCIHDLDGKKTRYELLAPWADLLDRYVIFMQGFVGVTLRALGLSRVHLAFLDGEHSYAALSREIAYVEARQQAGDLIICDDVTPSQFPGVVQAVEALTGSGRYQGELFTTEDGRGYMVCQRLA